MDILKLSKVAKSVKDKQILQNINLTVAEGEILGLLGPNGAGKTTMMKLISGLSLPTSGSIEIAGINALKERCKVKNKIGFVMQDNNMEREFTVKEALIHYARLYKIDNYKQAVAQIIDKFAMQEWQDRRIDKLSGGMARKAMIARALLAKPQLLLMDEPSVGLDPDVRLDIWEEIKKMREMGISIIITTHYMDEAEQLCDRIAILKAGQLLAIDTVEGIKHLVMKSVAEELTLEKAFLRFIGREVI